MANKYLEKIAMGIGSGIRAVVSGVGRVAKGTAKAVGNQVHLAGGGGFRDYAHNHFGVKDPFELSKFTFGGGRADAKRLMRMAQKHNKAGFSYPNDAKSMKGWARGAIGDLQKKQLDARIRVGAMGAAGAVGAVKLKQHLEEPQVQSYNYN